MTSDQNVTLGLNNTLTALFGNIDLNAGDGPSSSAPTPSLMGGYANAQAYVSGGIAGRAHAVGTSSFTSNSTLIVGTGDLVESGEDTNLAADPGTLTPLAQGIGDGDVFGIPMDNGTATPTLTTTSNMTISGNIIAGYDHQLDITIPNAGNVSADGQTNFYSDTLTDNGWTVPNVNNVSSIIPPAGYTPSAPFTAVFDPDYSPSTVINNAFGNGSTNSSILINGSSSANVGALEFGPLNAYGGDVTINAGTLQGWGSVTAYGGPTISVTNDSPDYLVFNTINIPEHSDGNVYFTGTANSAPLSMSVKQVNPGAQPVVTIKEVYDQPVGNLSNGPAVVLTDEVDNLAGQAAITVGNKQGSPSELIQIAAINAAGREYQRIGRLRGERAERSRPHQR